MSKHMIRDRADAVLRHISTFIQILVIPFLTIKERAKDGSRCLFK